MCRPEGTHRRAVYVGRPDAHAIRDALAKGGVTDAARKLGLTSRYALYRLMKKHGIDPTG
jgi:transcriptional regulator of acetoin/glycerol metabolism